MKYSRIIKQIAKSEGISKNEVDFFIRKALEQSGIHISPDIVVEIATEKIKKDYLL